MAAKKKKLSWIRVKGKIYQISPRVRAAAFAMLFSLVGVSGYMAYSASAAVNDRAFGGSCTSSKLGRVDVSASFDSITSKGSKLDYVVISNDRGLATRLPVDAHTYGGSGWNKEIMATYRATSQLSNTGHRQFRADPDFGVSNITQILVNVWPATANTTSEQLRQGCSVRITPHL